MNIKSNKGITILALMITIMILGIITSVGVSLSLNITGAAKFENVKTNLLLIQSKCKIAAEKNAIGEITEDELYGKLEELGEYEGWYLLSSDELYELGIKDAKASDNYYVDYENDDVAYGNGIEYNGNTYYKLSEMRDV